MLARLIDWSVDNRVLVCVVSALLAAAGLWSLRGMPLDAIPDLSDAQVIVHADWPGRDPQAIEDQVTYPISSALLNVSRVRDVRGFSFFGTSFVYVIFEDGTDPYWARSRVLEHLGQARRDLPPGVQPLLGPEASGMGWVFLYTLEDTLGERDLGELRTLQDSFVRHQLESVPGVAEVATLGGAVRQYQVTVDPRVLESFGLPLERVVEAIRRSNADVSGRVIEMAETEFMVRGRGGIESLDDLGQVSLGLDPAGTPIRLRDVADIEVGPGMTRGIAEKDGRGEVVAGIVTMRYGENALEVIGRVKRKIRAIQGGLPAGVVIRKAYDRSGLIRRSIATLAGQLAEELLIVALVCVVFLWHARSALVSSVVLPLGILVSFLVMRVLGVNANIMSLGGIAIAIGAMVDASVVMVENLHKHKEAAPDDADHWGLVRRSSREVGPALFFSLLVITVSFLPVFALEGQAGRLFRPLAFTKTCAMASAAVLTLMLMPVLMGFFVRGRVHGEARNPVSRLTIALYLPLLRLALRHRRAAIGLALLALALTWIPYSRLGGEFMPAIREGDVLAMPTTLPGISGGEARRTLRTQDRLLAEFPEVRVVLGKIGRADTALDPAPLSMVETHICLWPEERWPERVLVEGWTQRFAAPMVEELLDGERIDPSASGLPEADGIARQVALMSRAATNRWIRAELAAGRDRNDVLMELPDRLTRFVADDLVEYLRAQGALEDGRAARLSTGLYNRWRRAVDGDEIPLRRTTFAELTRVEMNEHVRVPGMPNWWLMPIETRIGMLATGMRGKLGLKLYGDDLAELQRYATDLEALLREVPGTSSVVAERALGGYYLDLDIDHARCALHGLTTGDVGDVVRTAVGGVEVTTAIDGRARIPVTVRYPRELRDDPVRLGRTLVATPDGGWVPLAELADISIRDGPPVIKSENGLLLTNVPIDLEPGVDIGSFVERAQGAIDAARASGRLEVPAGTYHAWSGQYRMLENVRRRLWAIVPATLALILVLIYLNTRSLAETLVTMATLPFALIGGVWLLEALDYDLSVAVAVGFIALAGLAAETAILMHVYLRLAYEKRASGGLLSGDDLHGAILDGAVLRLRPKLMTVVTTILALVPIMWASGAGAGPMKRMAAPMIGGLVTSTLHTLILIPVYYAMFHEWRARRMASRA